MKTMKKLIAVLAMLAVLATLLCACGSKAPETADGKSFTVVVVHADGSEKTFQYTSSEEFLGAVLVAEKLVEGEDSEYGLYITAVDGETADYNTDGAYWALYIGDEYATTGADSTPITEGATYKLVYAKG